MELQTTTTPILDVLPIEIVVLVLSFVPSVSDWKSFLSTCKRLNKIGKELFGPTIDRTKIVLQALVNRNPDVITFVLSHYKVSANMWYNAPTELACSLGHFGLFETLFYKDDFDPNANGNEAMSILMENDRTDMLVQLLSHPNADPSFNNNLALRHACTTNKLELVKLLLNHPKVDPSANEQWLLMQAIAFANLPVLSELLKHEKIDPSRNNNYALRLAAKFGDPNIVAALLRDSRVDPTDENNEAMILACEYGRANVINLLLQDNRMRLCEVSDIVICWAMNNRRWDVISMLLGNPEVDVRQQCWQLMYEATICNQVYVVKQIITHPKVSKLISSKIQKGFAPSRNKTAPRISV